MALNIKNAETERLARELSRRRNQGITEVVTEVLRKELLRERRGVHGAMASTICTAAFRRSWTT